MKTDWPTPPQHIHRTDDLDGIHLVLKTPTSVARMRPLLGLVSVLTVLSVVGFSILTGLTAPRLDIEGALGLLVLCGVMLVMLATLFQKNRSHDAGLTVTDRAIRATYQKKTQQVLLSEIITINTRAELELHSGRQVKLAPHQSRENRLWVHAVLDQWITQHRARQGSRSDVPNALHGLQPHT